MDAVRQRRAVSGAVEFACPNPGKPPVGLITPVPLSGEQETYVRMDWLIVALGSALGGVGRYVISVLMARVFGPRFPYGTLLVNMSGALAIGVYMGTLAPDAATVLHPPPLLGLTFGVLGGYTTFSSFSFETLYLLRDERYRAAVVYVVYVSGLMLLCVGAAGLGWYIAA